MKKSVKCFPYYDTLFYPDISNQLLPTNVANHKSFCYFLECHESRPLNFKKNNDFPSYGGGGTP